MKRKRLFGISLVLGLFFLLLTACGTKETTSEYSLSQNGVEMTVTYKAKGDKVIEQTSVNKIPYTSLGVTTKEEAKVLLDEALEATQGIEGYSDTIKYMDTAAIENVKIDYSKVDLDEVSQVPGMITDSSAKKNGVSLKKSEALLLDKGFKKTE